MTQYRITTVETIFHTLIIEADSREEATDKVWDYSDSKAVILSTETETDQYDIVIVEEV